MKPEFDPIPLLETLDPPAGGLAKLRRRLDRRRRRRLVVQRSLALAGAAAVVVLAAVAPFIGSSNRSPLPIGDELVAMQLGIIASPVEPASIPSAERKTTALLRVPTNDDRVVLYLVGSMSGG